MECYEEAIAINREIGYKEDEAINLYNFGLIWYCRGEPDKALTVLNDALSTFRSIRAEYYVMQTRAMIEGIRKEFPDL